MLAELTVNRFGGDRGRGLEGIVVTRDDLVIAGLCGEYGKFQAVIRVKVVGVDGRSGFAVGG